MKHKVIKQKTTLLIIGAGPCGLIAALLAKQHNLDVVVVEKQAEDHSHGNAHYLNAYSIEVLLQIGITTEQLLAIATPTEQGLSMGYGTNTQSLFADINLWSDPKIRQKYQQAGRLGACLNIGYSKLYPLLLEKIKEQGIKIHWKHELTDIDQKNHQATIQHQQQILTINTNYLIACDGHRSTVAKLAGIKRHNDKKWQTFLTVDCEGDISQFVSKPALLYWIYNPKIRACLVAHNLQRFQVLHIPIYPPHEHPSDYDQPRIEQILATIYDQPFDQLGINIGATNTWHMHTHILEKFHHDWLLFAGDSAHTTTPAGGMGLNTGIADVFNLIWKISHQLKHPNSNHLNSYQQERLPIAQFNVDQSIKNFHDFTRVPAALGLHASMAPLAPMTKRLPKILQPLVNTVITYGIKMATQLPHKTNPISQFVKQRLMRAITNDRQHFDGVNMHLGFSYQQGLVINPIKDNRPNNLANYTPKFQAGTIIGPVILIQNKQRHNLFDLINYQHWVAVVKDDSWDDLIKKHKLLPVHIDRDYQIENTDQTKLSELAEGELLVIRPDGIIAFRGRRDNQQFSVIDQALKDWLQ